jgi:hypothetical protein
MYYSASRGLQARRDSDPARCETEGPAPPPALPSFPEKRGKAAAPAKASERCGTFPPKRHSALLVSSS